MLHDLISAHEKSGWFRKFIVALRLKRLLSKYRRMNLFSHLLFKYWDFAFRLFNRFFLSRKKTPRHGLVIAVCGLDGCGKSTAVRQVNSFFSSKFSIRKIHFGRPSPTFLTFPFWLILGF